MMFENAAIFLQKKLKPNQAQWLLWFACNYNDLDHTLFVRRNVVYYISIISDRYATYTIMKNAAWT